MSSSLKFIDLFAGAGGLSEGFIKEGFNPVAHVEYDKAACFTLKTRIAFHYLVEQKKERIYFDYLKGKIKRKELYSHIPVELLKSVINAEIGKENTGIFDAIDLLLDGKKVDILIGGPPCQAYSVVGRAPLKNKKNDKRTTLYIQYGRFLKKYNPKVFVFENVPGILTASEGKYFKNLKKYYKRLGYIVEARILNAYDYGVVQHRERVIVVGWKKELNFSYPEIEITGKKYFRDDIFNDLPSIQPGETQRTQQYTNDINEYLELSSIRNGHDFICQHITRPHNNRDLKIYELAINLLEEDKRIKNDKIPESLRTQKNITSFLDRFKVVAKEPHTMIAHIANDGHHFIHPDKKQLRSISVREAARIQSFSDDYYFEGFRENQPRTAAFRQIGNAVPPFLARKIAHELLNKLHV